jgi:hypothetical protein
VFRRAGFAVVKGSPWDFMATPAIGGSFLRGDCGVHVFSGPDGDPDLVAIKVGSLDDGSDFTVQADIWMKSTPPWHRGYEGASRVEGNLAAAPVRTRPAR